MVLQYKNGFMIKAPWCSSVEKHMLLAEEKKNELGKYCTALKSFQYLN